jgi:hypothetical protein
VLDHFHIIIHRVDEGVDVTSERIAGIFGRALIHEGLNFLIGVARGIANPSFYEILFEGHVR